MVSIIARNCVAKKWLSLVQFNGIFVFRDRNSLEAAPSILVRALEIEQGFAYCSYPNSGLLLAISYEHTDMKSRFEFVPVIYFSMANKYYIHITKVLNI